MTRRRMFGSHLYNQIVVPLLVASVTVGLVATLSAVYFLGDLTEGWTRQVADAVATSLTVSYERYAEEMQRLVWLSAGDAMLRQHAASGDAEGLRASLIKANAALDFDDMAVLDESGTVLASVGSSGFAKGSTPLGDQGAARSGPGRSQRAIVARLGEKNVLVALQPFAGTDGRYYSVVLTRVFNDAFLRSMAVTNASASSFYGPDKRVVASALPATTDSTTAQALQAAMNDTSAPIADVLAQATGTGTGVSSVRVGDVSYQAFARRVVLSEGAERHGGTLGYVVSMVSSTASNTAGRTTMNLIITWTVIAVIALVALGGWVARTVVEQLAELSAGARRIADGDFSGRVEIVGRNEIAQVGEAFNDMTDSLKERSESLTKKVLELATLYEMSRALGSTLDMDELLGSVLDSALRIFDLDMGYVALRDKESDMLAVRAVRGTAGPTPDAVRSSMSDWVVREGRPLIFNPNPTAGHGQVDAVTGARAALCVPLATSEGTIGSITVGSAEADYRFNSDDVRLLSTIANHVAIAIGNIELFTSLQEAYLATVRSLAAAVDAKDTYTRGHSDRVAMYAALIADSMGVSHEQRIALEMAAFLHDIGKIGVSEEILLKPGTLTGDEMEQMRHHPLIGANILKPVAFPWAITPIVRHHHENYDGTGYPAGLKGEEIPLLARILTAADSYEAMTADRPYRSSLTADAALDELRNCAGTQFDPRIVEVLVAIVEEEQRANEDAVAHVADEITPEEVRAIFAALVDGVFSSFRRLGGPRLASNVEADVDQQFQERGWPFQVTRGRVNFTAPAGTDDAADLEQMRAAMRCIDVTLGKVSGATLVDHFYTDAYQGFSERLGRLADALGFRASR